MIILMLLLHSISFYLHILHSTYRRKLDTSRSPHSLPDYSSCNAANYCSCTITHPHKLFFLSCFLPAKIKYSNLFIDGDALLKLAKLFGNSLHKKLISNSHLPGVSTFLLVLFPLFVYLFFNYFAFVLT